jgi:ketosteroid isomerase-like protein
MPSRNQAIVEACRLAYSGFENNQREPLLALLAPDVVFEFPKSLPYGGVYKGLNEFKAFWADLYENYYEYFNYDAHAVLDCGSHVIVPVVARAKAKNGKTMENEHCFLFKIKDGKIVYGRIYADTAKGRDVLEGLQIHPSRASA